MAEASLPFEGLKVIEVATFIAAPVAATILGDLGADVIKIEPPGEGDPYRALPNSPMMDDVGVNFTWVMDARCKRSVTLNLKSPAGIEILKRLVRVCDIFICNQPFPVREKFGLTYEELAPLNPRMIYASLTAYGEVGPERDRAAFDQVAYWARSGLLELMRAPGSVPAQGLPGMGDHPTGVSLYAAIMTALYQRERTGKGGMVHTSLHANGFWSNGCLGQAALAGMDFTKRRNPSLDPNRPLGATGVLYETSDRRYVQLNMIRTDEQMEAALRVLGISDLLDDPKFATPDDRLENGVEFSAKLRAVIETRHSAELFREFSEAGVPANQVPLVEEIGNDEQAKANKILLEADKSQIGMSHVINHPIGLSGIVGRGPTRPPEVGEHNDEVLAELGFSTSEVEQFRHDEVI